MNMYRILGLICLALMTACTVPTASDFESPSRPLSQDEFLVLWRFPSQASPAEVLEQSPTFAASMESAMAPLFQQMIPQIFSDIKAGKLTLRMAEDIADVNEQPITDVPAWLSEHFDGSWKNIQPFMQVFHLSQRRNIKTKGFLADELELILIGKDPEGKLPERHIGAVSMNDLVNLKYTVESNDKSYALQDYLETLRPYVYPIHYLNLDAPRGLHTLEQAFGTKSMLLKGQWGEIEWLADQPNLSGYSFQPLSKETMQPFTGVYQFEANQGSDLSKGDASFTVSLSIEEDHFHSDWPNQHPWFEFPIFPTTNGRFFTVNGNLIQFETLENGQMKISIEEPDGTITVGLKK